MFRRAPRSAAGQTLTEFGLVVALVAIVVIGVMTALGSNINTSFSAVDSSIANAGGGSGSGNPAAFSVLTPNPEPGQLVSFDGPSSATTWSWDFDEDSVEDASIEDPSFTFPAAGTYLVTLTTDEGTASQAVEVAASLTDSFERTVSGGWGTSSSGALWAITGGTAANFSVDGNEGQIIGPVGTWTRETATLPVIAATDDTVTVSFAFTDEVAHTTTSQVEFRCGPSSTTSYGFDLWDMGSSDGTLYVYGDGVTANTTISTTGYERGTPTTVKLVFDGTGTALWLYPTGDPEPSTPTLEAVGSPSTPRTDAFTECELMYLNGGPTPITLHVDNFDFAAD